MVHSTFWEPNISRVATNFYRENYNHLKNTKCVICSKEGESEYPQKELFVANKTLIWITINVELW